MFMSERNSDNSSAACRIQEQECGAFKNNSCRILRKQD